MTTSATIIDEIMRHMPKNSDRYVLDDGFSDIKLSIHWKLNNDPERPNKYSKTIVIIIPRELLEDFPNYPENMQSSALSNIGLYITEKQRTFNPDHDVPKYQQPPTEQWVIPVERLFG